MKRAALTLAMCVCSSPAYAALVTGIPEECGSASELESELEQRIGPNTSLDSTRISVAREGEGYSLLVEVGSERRELHDQSCRELVRAAVVITIALLEPERHAEPEPRAEPIRPVQPVPARASEPPTPRSRAPRPRIALGADVGLHIGTTPRVTPMIDVDAQLLGSRFGVALGARYLFASSETDGEGHGARVSALGAYAAGTLQLGSRVQTRLGLVGYRLFGEGLGTVQASNDAAWELAPLLGASFVPFQSPPFWTSLGAEAQLNLLRPSFEILHYDSVFRVPVVSGSAFARAGVVW